MSIPLRIFDRNQGEKKRTLIDIDRSQQASEAARAQVFSDVDTAYELVRSNIALLKPYKEKYNDQALRVRDTVTYAYEHGSASLMDCLNAQSDYRQVQLAYAQLIGSYLTAVGQTESCRWTGIDPIKGVRSTDMQSSRADLSIRIPREVKSALWNGKRSGFELKKWAYFRASALRRRIRRSMPPRLYSMPEFR